MDLYLIFKGREKDISVSHAKCSLKNKANPREDEEPQADFICKVEE